MDQRNTIMSARQLLMVGGVLALGCCGCVSGARLTRNLAEMRDERAASEAVLLEQVRHLEDEVFHVRQQVVDVLDEETRRRSRENDDLKDQLAGMERTLVGMIGDESMACGADVQDLHAALARVVAGMTETIRRESVARNTREQGIQDDLASMERSLTRRIGEETSSWQTGDALLREVVAEVEDKLIAKIVDERAAQAGDRETLYARLAQMELAWDARFADEAQARLGEDVCLLDLIGDDQGELVAQVRRLEGRMSVLSDELASQVEAEARPVVHAARTVLDPEPDVHPSEDGGPPFVEPEEPPDTTTVHPTAEPTP